MAQVQQLAYRSGEHTIKRMGKEITLQQPAFFTSHLKELTGPHKENIRTEVQLDMCSHTKPLAGQQKLCQGYVFMQRSFFFFLHA